MRRVADVVAHVRAHPSLAVILAEAFLARLGFSMVTFALPFYAKSLGFSLTEIGALIALRIVVSIFFKPVMGMAADKFGVKSVYVGSIAGRCAIALLFVLATQPWALFVVRGLQGLTSAAREPAAALLVVEHADDAQVARSFSWYAAARAVGMALGFPVAGLVLSLTGDDYRVLFLLTAIVSAVACALVWRYAAAERPVRSQPAVAAGPADGHTRRSASDWLRIAPMVLLMAIPANMVDSLFPLIVTERIGLDKAGIGLIYALSMGVVVIAGPLLGWAADTVSRRLVLAVRCVANVVSSLLYLVLPGFWGMTTARLVDDIGRAAFKPAWGSMMGEIARSGDKASRGRRLAYLDTAESIGEAAGPVLAGLLWQHGGIGWLFGVRVALSIVAELHATWTLRRTAAATDEPGSARRH